MGRYTQLGEVPAKRHVQFRRDGKLLTEEVIGFEGFSGNESILYHLHSPCRVAEVRDFQPIIRDEWVPETHVHRLTDTNPVEPGGDFLTAQTAASVERRHRGVGREADFRARGLLPERRGRRDPVHPSGNGNGGDHLRRRSRIARTTTS